MNLIDLIGTHLLVIIFFILLAIACWLIVKLLKKPLVFKYGLPISINHSVKHRQKALFSSKYLLTGRPDYIIKSPTGTLIPVELKSTSLKTREPYESHILQVIAYCTLIEECYGRRPEYGIIQYSDGYCYKVPYTDLHKNMLLNVISKIRKNIIQPVADSRCVKCSFNNLCPYATALTSVS
jgi:CRISPR-associated exonuclease Cas4